MSDGLHPHCISCGKHYYNEKREKTRRYYLENCDKINTRENDYSKNRIRTDVNFRLNRNTRRRIHHALNGK